MSFFTKQVEMKTLLKILMLIAVSVPAILGLINFYHSPKSELTVDVYYTDVIWPQALENHFDSVYSLTNKYPLQRIMFGDKKTLAPEEEVLVERTSTFYKNQLEQSIPFRLYWIHTAWKIVIKNTGTDEVEPFTITIPRMSHFEVVTKSGARQPYFNFNEIPIEGLLANDDITIHAWGGQVYSELDGSPLVKIAHDGVSLKYAQHKYLKEEYRNSVYDYVYLQIAFAVFVLLVYIIAKWRERYSINITKRDS